VARQPKFSTKNPGTPYGTVLPNPSTNWRSSGRRLCSPRLEAFPAKHRASLCRTEGDGGLLAAPRAGGLGLNLRVAIVLSLGRRRTHHGQSLAFACLAAFRFVLELLVVKEKLLPGREDEIGPTVDALQHLVLKFH